MCLLIVVQILDFACACSSRPEMEKVEEVVIDPDGVFKYILIELTEKKKAKGATDQQPRKMTIVRGFEWAEFHGALSFISVA